MAEPTQKQEHVYHRHSSSIAPTVSRDKKQKTAGREVRINNWLQDEGLARLNYISLAGVKDEKPEKGSSAQL
ncbi:hypothetical protein MCOR25_001236 [Pyricularia grisea]|uniref:Uncharacterized protein n=1 Tax=Pyricularia grisea TaxID=148305 RepID=A0A6P8BIS7_PYRGI|nr:uncharacterized protein PgNI_00760 [Pyricularia grisea]KAI6381302.1 hypothetical protein MCOR25_001236 [Pyricularia grisea]TLD16522.1 hypothetical protein PgNI_00760 [Pyricularia grisea]